MSPDPVVVRGGEREWEEMENGDGTVGVLFKTLVSSGLTPSEALTLGVAKVPPGGGLREHRHRQAEVYLVLAGEGSVSIGGETRPVEAGSAVFVPGDAWHSCVNTGASELRLAYVIAADSFDDVEYVFGA